jgi:hypothetical protein
MAQTRSLAWTFEWMYSDWKGKVKLLRYEDKRDMFIWLTSGRDRHFTQMCNFILEWFPWFVRLKYLPRGECLRNGFKSSAYTSYACPASLRHYFKIAFVWLEFELHVCTLWRLEFDKAFTLRGEPCLSRVASCVSVQAILDAALVEMSGG